MKTVDEHGTIVYFNIPEDAIITTSQDELVIMSGNPVGTVSGMNRFMQFARASSTKHRTSKYFYLLDNEFTLLQKDVEQHFAKPIFLGAHICEEGITNIYKTPE